MPTVRDLVSALNKLAHAAHVRPPGPGPAAAVPPAPTERAGAGEAYTRAGVEPPIDEVLRDPIVRALMRRDGLRPEEVRRGRPPRRA